MGVVLGIHGPALSGKDTVADHLLSEYGWDEKLSFAKNLKEMCKAIFFLSDYDLYDQEGKKKMFSTPKEFTGRNLGSVLHWMSRTHASFPLIKGTKETVRSLIGTKFNNPRDILQFVGTDICRELVPTYHIDIIMLKVREKPDARFVISDVRFPNEGDLILDNLSGLVIKLDRPGVNAENINKNHPSETAMRDWGRFTDVLENHREGLPFLYEEVDSFLRKNGLCPTTQL